MLQKEIVNNEIYKHLGDKWYTGNDYVALLRAESKTRNPWILNHIYKNNFVDSKVLDIGCGGGLLTNYLSKFNFNVTGIDNQENALHIAKKYDESGSVTYQIADAHQLPYDNETFDIVCSLDLFEHVDDYTKVIKEGVRVLKKNGLFFFHTFNRNFLSWLFVIKGMEWFVKNTPKNLHVYQFFIKPKEIINNFSINGCNCVEIKGLMPKLFSSSFVNLIKNGEVDENFDFSISRNLFTGYIGYVKKIS